MARMRGREASTARWLKAWRQQAPEPLVVGVVEQQHRRLEVATRGSSHHRMPTPHIRRLARIDREGAVREDRPRILEAGQKQPAQFRVTMDWILGSQPIEIFMRALTEDLVDCG
jgi:hypothetical protein